MARPAMASTIKAYAVPLTLFLLALYYQLVVLPRSFPPSHYEVLGMKRHSSIEEVKDAYEKLSSKWNSGEEVPSTADFLKVRYAYELLIHPLWKRDYDIYGIDEQLHVLDKVREQHGGDSFSQIDLPLLDAATSDYGDYAFNVITSKDFLSMFKDTKPRLIQVYSDASYRCAQFSNAWKRIGMHSFGDRLLCHLCKTEFRYCDLAALLEGIANTGMVELGEVQLATYLAERKPTGQFFFRNGVPLFVAFPTGCKTADCVIRFDGELSVDAVTDWFATTILNLPRIFYYTKESLGKDFLAKAAPHKAIFTL
ncbi:hypothetical protein Patl1_18786 [Pistacia atlantica]|uniref:Uncharacterized protein n=1 Tax=Pistacia atlantica TaxID=434234 RepID=A0ACC1BZD7_9ROSI|nr:hypothetical protein Patl1_18786 [Pistacia atlantica]